MDGFNVYGKRKGKASRKTLDPLNLEEARVRAPWLKSMERLEVRVLPTSSGAPYIVGCLNDGSVGSLSRG